MGLRIKDCTATPSSITIFFSDAVQKQPAGELGNYTVEQLPGKLVDLTGNASAVYDQIRHVAVITITKPNVRLQPGNWIAVTVNRVNVKSESNETSEQGGNRFATGVDRDRDEVKNIGRATRGVDAAFAYPVPTEEVGYAPSPLARPSGPPAAMPGAPLRQTATKAISDVLG